MEGGKQLIQGSACSANRRTQDQSPRTQVTMPVAAALSWKPNKEGQETGRFLKFNWPTSQASSISFQFGEGPCLKTVWNMEMIKEVSFYLLYKTWASILMITLDCTHTCVLTITST